MAITKDIAIRVSGLLQAIMSNQNIPHTEWDERLKQALLLHNDYCRKLSGGSNGKTEERRG